jgi:CHAT domain-containing protein
MNDLSQNEILQKLAEDERRGDFVQASRLIRQLPEKARARPAVALRIVRLQTNQGDFKAAADALRRADFSAANEGEKLIAQMQEIQVGIYGGALDIETAGRQAEKLFKKSAKAGIRPVEAARAKQIFAQVLLFGVFYSVFSNDRKLRAQKLLREAIAELENDGRAEEAFSARLSYADSLSEAETRLLELDKLIVEAADYPDVAAKAYCTQALVMLQNAFPSDKISLALAAAEKNFAAAGHRYGHIDVQHLRVKLRIERAQSAPDSLLTIIEQYGAVEYIRGELSALMDITQLFHENGNLEQALGFHERLTELSEKSGFMIFRYNAELRRAEVLTRNGKFSQATELCNAALALPNMPPALAAAYRQLLGTAYSFVKNYEKSASYFEAAKEVFEKINLPEAASNIVVLQINDLDSMKEDEAWREAEKILLTQLEKDENRRHWELVIRYCELLAQIKLNQFSFSPTRKNDASLLAEAEAIIVRAEKLVSKLPPRQAALRAGALHQIRGLLAANLGNPLDAIDELTRAAEVYQTGGFELEAANCRYMIGVIFHNLASLQILPNALLSQAALLQAAGYYEKAAMGMQAGDAHYLLANLYNNTIAALAAGAPNVEYLIQKAFEHIRAAEGNFDSIRRDYFSSDALEAQRDKQSIIEKSARLYQLGLELYIWKTNDLSGAWHWMQRAKGRGLTDNLAGSFGEPQKLLAEIGKNPAALASVQKELELTARIRRADAASIPALRKELSNLHQLMLSDPVLKDYIELRTGAAIDAEDLKAIADEEKESGSSCVFIDWVNIGRTLFLVCLRAGSDPQFIPLAIDLQTVQDFVRTHLSDAGFRSTMRDNFELLDRLNPLVSPLETVSEPEELLVFSPTGILYALPLHALKIGEQSLIDRNPVIYEPSLSVLRHCYARRRKMSENPEVMIFGDPTGDRPDALAAARALSAAGYGAQLLTGQEVTRAAFIQRSQQRDVVHFQGHARFDSVNPVDSHLLLADGQMNVRDIFSNLNLNAELVALTACESGISEIKTGDEPLGLIPALIYAGSRSVLATLWRVNQKSAAEFTGLFYDSLYNSGKRPDRARALRKTVLELKENDDFSTPYHWAGYVLYGDWR